MGIPALFRWLSDKYPKIMSNVIEDEAKAMPDSTVIPVDSSLKNPNGVEIDNLYLDMNGIIHPCCHPEDKAPPETEEEMYIEIFKYIDRIFRMIRPRKVLYMAIDGVAPRAKMNQQRSRRFRAAQEEAIKQRAEERIRIETGVHLDPTAKKKMHFDSNCITPGTPFMEQLAICLRYYVVDRLNNDPGWKGVQVILSDASVPGEGEHKIMDYIRHQRTLSTYDPSTKHVLYGLDADLIMLALATHEPNFWILREEVNVKRNKEKACTICGQSGHDQFQCQGQAKEKVGKWDDQSKYLSQKPFLFVHISVLREYLDVEMRLLDAPFEWNLERAIDDWIFMCFFVGNDFLPHLPSLEIREGAVELLIGIWKNQAKNWDGYLTDSGEIRLDRVQMIMEELGNVEDQTFKDRRDGEEQRRIARLEKKRNAKLGRNERDDYGRLPKALLKSEEYIQSQMSMVETYSVKAGPPSKKRPLEGPSIPQQPKKPSFSHQNPTLSKDANLSAAKKLKMQLLAKVGKAPVVEKNPTGGFSMTDFEAPTTIKVEEEEEEEEEVVEEEVVVIQDSVPAPAAQEQEGEEEVAVKEELDEDDEEEEEEEEVEGGAIIPEEVDSDHEAPQDDVRLWEDGWKARYYEKKFDVDVGDETFRQKVVKSYVEGLCWVLKYYYQGVQSWKWYFPFHYSPFASDFKSVGSLTITFEKSQPFKPIEQLMGVFPAASKQHIPPVFHDLMTEDDSPIIDFYPVDFPIDLNGKKYAWQGVALLPFIDADRLLAAIEPLYSQLTAEEQDRNKLGSSVIFCSGNHTNFENLCALYKAPPIKKPVNLDPLKSARICGTVFKDPQVTLPGSSHSSPLLEFELQDILNMSSISAFYYLPRLPANYQFRAALLPNAEIPLQILDDNDKYQIRNGLTGRGRGRGRGGGGRGGHRSNAYTRHGLVLTRSSSNSSYGGNGYERSDYGNYGSRNDSYERNDSRTMDSSRSYRGGYRNDTRQSYPPTNRSNGYDRGGDSRPRRDDRSSSFSHREERSSYRSDRSYSARDNTESTYMGGGGYSSYNRDGKYQGGGDGGQSSYSSQSYQGGYQQSRQYSSQSSYNDRSRPMPYSQPQSGYNQSYSQPQSGYNQSYQTGYNQSYSQPQTGYNQSYSQSQTGYNQPSQGYNGYYSGGGQSSYSAPQPQHYSAQAPPARPNQDGAALVANLLSMLPGGSGYQAPTPNGYQAPTSNTMYPQDAGYGMRARPDQRGRGNYRGRR